MESLTVESTSALPEACLPHRKIRLDFFSRCRSTDMLTPGMHGRIAVSAAHAGREDATAIGKVSMAS